MRAAIWLLLSTIGGWPIACQHPDRGDSHPSSPVPSVVASAQGPLWVLGETAVLPAYRLRLVSQRECPRSGASASRASTRAWGAELEITNTGSDRIPANPFYATLQDDQKFSYTTSLADCGSLLPSKFLEPNESVRGVVPFELPSTTPNVTLTYRPVLRGNVNQNAQFRIEL